MLAGGLPCSCIQHWPNDGPASETLGRRWASAVCLLMAQCLPASAWHTLILHSSCYNLISPLRADFPDLQYDCQGIGLMQSSKLPVVFHRRRQIQLGDSSAVESHLYDPISRCDNWLLWAICPIWCFAGRRVGGAVVKLGINTARSWRLGRLPPPHPPWRSQEDWPSSRMDEWGFGHFVHLQAKLGHENLEPSSFRSRLSTILKLYEIVSLKPEFQQRGTNSWSPTWRATVLTTAPVPPPSFSTKNIVVRFACSQQSNDLRQIGLSDIEKWLPHQSPLDQ